VILAIERASPHGGPSSGLAAARYHTVASNAAVHHSKNCALMSQMGHWRRIKQAAASPYVRFTPKADK
jgi:hypothetical protein